MKEIIDRLLTKYEQMILILENINEENKAFVTQANENPDDPAIRTWAKLARENQRRLSILKAERDNLVLIRSDNKTGL